MEKSLKGHPKRVVAPPAGMGAANPSSNPSARRNFTHFRYKLQRAESEGGLLFFFALPFFGENS